MLVLLDHPVPADVRSALSHLAVLHRPLLHGEPRARRLAALSREGPDVLLTRTAPDPAELAELDAWRRAAGERPFVVAVVGATLDTDGAGGHGAGGNGPASHGASSRRPAPGRRLSVVTRTSAVPDESASGLYSRALAQAERRWFAARVGPGVDARLGAVRPGAASCVLVGAGAVNLLTGLRLLRAGHRVTFLDSAPDPRGTEHWTAYGCTRGGGDARMFTLTEADGYYETSDTGPVSFLRPVKDGGWCLADLARLSGDEVAWARDNRRVPPWLARDFTEDVLGFNLSAQRLWERMLRDEPALFGDVGLREGILRLYSDPAGLAAHARRQRALVAGDPVVLTAREVVERCPALAGAGEAFVGGIEVPGFTVQVHRFLGRLIDVMEAGGAVFRWSRTVRGLVRGRSGLLEGLRCGVPGTDGTAGPGNTAGPGPAEVVRADHYVLSPGAYGGSLLAGTPSEGLVHGVVGAWVTLPNPPPELLSSLKLSRTGHTAADANVTVTEGLDGQSHLTVGSGYGWTGADPRNIDPAQLDALYAAVDDTASCFFPEPFAEARRSGLLEESRRYCVRPWTASSLPVLDIGGTVDGGVTVVTGGHNTGGFAQAPVVAEAVAAAVSGERHPMHISYHPDRLRAFYGQDERRTGKSEVLGK